MATDPQAYPFIGNLQTRSRPPIYRYLDTNGDGTGAEKEEGGELPQIPKLVKRWPKTLGRGAVYIGPEARLLEVPVPGVDLGTKFLPIAGHMHARRVQPFATTNGGSE